MASMNTYGLIGNAWCLEHDRKAERCHDLAREDFGLPLFSNCELWTGDEDVVDR